MENKKIVVVLSMGRSGSSALTRCLKVLDINLGNSLFKTSNEINKKGNWEDVEIETLSEQILFYTGLNHFKTGLTIPNNKIDIPASLREKAIAIIASKTKNCAIYGFKDVRTWKILPFWKSIFRQLSLDPTYILSTRNPIDVIDSIERLGSNRQGRAYLLWLESITTMMMETDNESRLVVEYDQLIENPSLQTHRIAQAIGIEKSEINHQALREYSSQFLDKRLRHSSSSLEKIQEIPYLPDLIYRCYSILQKLAKDQLRDSSTEVKEFFHESRSQLTTLAPLLRTIDALDDSLMTVGHMLENALLQIGSSAHAYKKGSSNNSVV